MINPCLITGIVVGRHLQKFGNAAVGLRGLQVAGEAHTHAATHKLRLFTAYLDTCESWMENTCRFYPKSNPVNIYHNMVAKLQTTLERPWLCSHGTLPVFIVLGADL